MIKFGYRKNLLYPTTLTIFVGLRRIVELIIIYAFNQSNLYLLTLIIFFSEFIFGLISYYRFLSVKKSETVQKYFGIKLIQAQQESFNFQVDSQIKIKVLIFFASFFNYFGTMIRKCYESDSLIDIKLRSFETIISALLCYFTIKIQLYRHNIFSLVIIFLCLIIFIISEMIIKTDKIDTIELIILSIFSGLGRAYLDTIEKYLYEFNNVSPFQILMLEGLIDCFFLLIHFVVGIFFDSKSLEPIIDEKENWYKLLFIILLLILYFILSGFKNIYRVATIKLYSPTTRALAETFLDPIDYMFNSLYNGLNGVDEWINFGINLFFLLLIDFCTCVYNDFIILYCFGLEHNTYLEITKRSTFTELNIINDQILENNSEIDSISEFDDNEISENQQKIK